MDLTGTLQVTRTEVKPGSKTSQVLNRIQEVFFLPVF
jgi:hypothetical protein